MEEIKKYDQDILTAFAERTVKRLWVLIILLVLLLFGTNTAWIIYESQFAFEETKITQESAEGTNNYVGNNGVIYNGEANGHDSPESSQNWRENRIP